MDASEFTGSSLEWELDLGGDVETGNNAPSDFPITVRHTFTNTATLVQENNVTFTVTGGDIEDAAYVIIEVLRVPNDAQQGTVDMCMWNQLLPFWGNAVGAIDPGGSSEIVEVHPGTYFNIEFDGSPSGNVSVAFVKDTGEREMRWGTSGLVPQGVAFGSICASMNEAINEELPTPFVPDSGMGFTYQDGIPVHPDEFDFDG